MNCIEDVRARALGLEVVSLCDLMRDGIASEQLLCLYIGSFLGRGEHRAGRLSLEGEVFVSKKVCSGLE